jgi:YHS domain-containing protein
MATGGFSVPPVTGDGGAAPGKAVKEVKKLKPQETCPVMGDAINKKIFVDVNGERIYVCSEECKITVAKDPEKYKKALADRGESVEVLASLKPQTLCPVMGNAINKKLYVDKNGLRIYMCCPGCKADIEKNFDKYVKKLKDMGQQPEKL